MVEYAAWETCTIMIQRKVLLLDLEKYKDHQPNDSTKGDLIVVSLDDDESSNTTRKKTTWLSIGNEAFRTYK